VSGDVPRSEKMPKKRRTKIEIIKDILEVMEREGGSVNKTKIVYGANLNFKRATRVLNWLIEKGLVNVESDRYEITERGKEVLREIHKLMTLF